MPKHKCEECSPGAPKWLATFSDMATLLLTFFILLISMASFDAQKIRQALGALSGGLGILEGGNQTTVGKPNIIQKMEMMQNKESRDKTTANLKNYMEAANLAKMVSVVKTDKGISVRIVDSVLYEPGSARLLDAAKPILDKLAVIIQDAPFDILVEGHTDDTPGGGEFSSNWDLSTARAVSVVRYFESQGISPQKLSASGYAQYHPLLPNITPENRAKNRRVEINFVSPELAESGQNIFEENSEGAPDAGAGAGGIPPAGGTETPVGTAPAPAETAPAGAPAQ